MLHRIIICCLLIGFLSGCSTSELIDRGRYYADSRYTSQQQSSGEQARVVYLILHYTVSNDRNALLTLTQGNVSSHYLVPARPKLKEGRPIIWQLVEEKNIAFHAGQSHWGKTTNLNQNTIGIEIVNPGFSLTAKGDKHWYPYANEQIEALILLINDIMQKNKIKPENVLAHSDIAPLRKQDPGPLFPWQKLSHYGIGAWPEPSTVNRYLAGRAPLAKGDITRLQKALREYGYTEIPVNGRLDAVSRQIISAFQMHYRPMDISGNADAETEAIALALVEKYRR